MTTQTLGKEANETLRAANPSYRLREVDQTAPAGMWQVAAQGGDLLFQFATDATWTAFTTVITVTDTPSVTINGTVTFSGTIVFAANVRLDDDVVVLFGDDSDYFMGYSATDDKLEIGTGASIGSNVALSVDSSGSVILGKTLTSNATSTGTQIDAFTFQPPSFTLDNAATARGRAIVVDFNNPTVTGPLQITTRWEGISLGALNIDADQSGTILDSAAAITMTSPAPSGANITLTEAIGIRFGNNGSPVNKHAILITTQTASSAAYMLTLGSSDVDHNLIHVGVTGDPIMMWDQSEDAFSFSKGIRVADGSLFGSSSAGFDTSAIVQIEDENLTNTVFPLFLRNDGSGSTLAGTGVGLRFQVGDANAGPSDVGFVWGYNTSEAFDGDEFVAIRAGNTAGTSTNGQLVVKANGNVGIGSLDPSGPLTVTGSGYSTIQRTMTNSDTLGGVFGFKAHTNQDMTAGWGVGLRFVGQDIDSGEENAAIIGPVRESADDTWAFEIDTYNGGSQTRALSVSAAGVLSVKASGSGSAAQVDLFDKYDDATELRRFAYSSEGVAAILPITEDQRIENRERMVELGILTPNTGASGGYHVRIQPLMGLLAGGIYQTRQRLDDRYSELSGRLEALGG